MTIPSSTLTSKGQVTIPLAIRERLGLKEGDRVEFLVENDRTILRPGTVENNPFEQFAGILPAFRSREEINGWVSELRDEDDGNAG